MFLSSIFQENTLFKFAEEKNIIFRTHYTYNSIHN